MLESAESLLNQDIEEELELLARDPYVPLVNPKKYGKAKALFEKVLSQGPDNKRAKEELSACDEMLEPYILVQYMEPPDEVIGDPSPFEKGLKPWESRCRMRLRDRRGLDFTSKAFAEEEAWARSEALKMVEEAKKEVEEGGEPMEVYRLTLEKLEAFQERLHRGWKGHGPDILEFSITALKDALSSKELAKPKKPEDQRGTDVWMRDWKPETGYELRACVACGSLEVLPIFYISYEGEGIAFQQSLLYKCPACGRGIIQRLDYDSFDWESVFAQYEW